ncbi:hypothetical protein BDD43_0673 [Mucilaginibacter gracilis]|uniref:JmjC domain-containing protein n=1 Tax=Mucilaginibacter gracilis TaxID=423350 RepID=A0A495IVE9_9SPHI|nr:hypothetical protein [Mucilaginibacter gracilis]RKR80552.1 hypothetical protein BDD43_0673 [Mucilaginibacter gracilis]
METISLPKSAVKPFSDEWWNVFLDNTNAMKKTTVFNNVLEKNETALFRECIMGIISTLGQLKTNQYGYRVYLDGHQLQSNNMYQVYSKSPIPGESLDNWVNRAFGDKKFGLIINSGEKFDLQLSKNIALKVKPLLDKVGFPVEGINWTIFIGNYDKTPLGVHVDPPGENVMHFHLGPGPKTMYTWSKEEYEALAGNKINDKGELDRLLPYATTYTFGEGDLYFMPQGEYHIGQSDGLSIALTFWFYNHSEYAIAHKLQKIINDQYLKGGKDLLMPDQTDMDSLDGIASTINLFKFSDDIENLSYKDLLRQSYLDLRHTVASNAGYRTSPFQKEEDVEFDLTDVISLELPYKLNYRQSLDNKKLFVYARGIKLSFNYISCIKDFIDEINTGKPLLVSDLLAKLDQSWEPERGLYLLNLLYKHHAINAI